MCKEKQNRLFKSFGNGFSTVSLKYMDLGKNCCCDGQQLTSNPKQSEIELRNLMQTAINFMN